MENIQNSCPVGLRMAIFMAPEPSPVEDPYPDPPHSDNEIEILGHRP
jgi:hypothetical protein